MNDALHLDCVLGPGAVALRCRSCGSTKIDALEKRQNDETEDYRWRAERERVLERYATDFFQWLMRRYRVKGRTLEVGCSVGTFVATAERLGFDAEGVDIDRNAVAVGITRGRRLRNGTIADCTGPYDLVFCNHVFEHIQKPEKFLREIYERLVPGGAFATAMPHVGLEARIRGRRWMGWGPTEHYWLYSRPGLRQLLERSGFDVAAVDVRNGVAGDGLRENASPLLFGKYVARQLVRAVASATGSGCQIFVLALRSR